MKIVNWKQDYLHHRIVSAVKRVEFVSHRVSYTSIVLRDRWCNIIVQNAPVPSEEICDDSKDRDIQNYNSACCFVWV